MGEDVGGRAGAGAEHGRQRRDEQPKRSNDHRRRKGNDGETRTRDRLNYGCAMGKNKKRSGQLRHSQNSEEHRGKWAWARTRVTEEQT